MPRRSRYDDFGDFYPPSKPQPTDDGIKARSQRGKIGQSWWADRWIAALEQLVDAGRMRRGRSYARTGQVLSITETKEGIAAKVQGSRATPYKVTIRLAPLADQQWEQAIDQMADQAVFAAQLLAGEMPANIEEAFEAAGVSLFPAAGADLQTDCSCPDWANPCKHVAATHYILGEQFDDDPFLIFRLRGRTQEQILAGLRSRRASAGEEDQAEPQPGSAIAEAQPEFGTPLEEQLADFWQPAEQLDAFPVSIRPPALAMSALKRLGPASFLLGQDAASILGQAYQAITDATVTAAYGTDEPDAVEPRLKGRPVSR